MGRGKNLIKNTAILTIGKICTQMITFFLLPLYTAILSTEEYGTVDLLNTLVSLLLPVVTFQVEQALFRNLIEVRNDEDRKKEVISTGIFSVIIQCLIYISIFAIISPLVHNEYKIFLATNVVAYIFSSLMQQIARGLGNNKQFAIGSFVSAIITIVTNVILLIPVKLGANGMLLGNMIGQIACAIYLYIILKLYKYCSFKEFKYNTLKKLWKYSVPLIPNAISWWIFNASDRIIVTMLLGIGQNGILSAAHKFSTVYITLYNIFNMSWTEMISVHIDDIDIQCFFNKMFNIMLRLFISMGIGIISCMPFIYPIMIDNKFASGYYQVPIMILGSIFNVVVGLISVIYVAKKNTKAIANTSVVSAIINIVVHLLLINFVGLYAATISTLTAYFIMSVYRLYDIKKKYFKIIIEKSIIIKSVLILIIVLPLYYLKNYVLCAIGLMLTIVYAWNLNKDSIDLIFDMLKNKLHLKKTEE